MIDVIGKISKESRHLPLEIPMYDCSKIKRLTVLYTSKGPGTYAGEQRKILDEEESASICQEANRRQVSIEMLLKSRGNVEAVVINTVIPFEHHVKAVIQESAKKAKEESSGEQKPAQAEKPAEQKVPGGPGKEGGKEPETPRQE